MRWLLFAGLLLAAPQARAEDAHAEMARALEASADLEPPPAALPLVSPIAQVRETPKLPAAASNAAVKATAAANGRAMAAALARAARAASDAASAAADRAAKVRVHGREHPGRGVDR